MSTRARRILEVLITGVLIAPLLGIAILWLTLPEIGNLHQRAQAPSSKIFDRNGILLYEIIDPRVGHHTPLTFDRIPAAMRQATIAVEDANFYKNPGVDIAGIVRALWINVQGGEVLAGGSTITQQLARMLVLNPDERSQRTLLRKVRESLLAWQIAQRFSKEEVLALYLNETYYGNLAYGVEAAARTYFGKSTDELELAECALLAGLPQSPLAYDPFTDPIAAKRRQGVVIDLMVKEGVIASDQGDIARQAHLSYAPAPFAIRAPHFVTYVRHWIEERYGSELLTRGGILVSTTLDLALNDAGLETIRARLKQLQSPSDNSPDHNTNNAALVALDPHTGAIVTMVGSPGFFDASISGAVNGAIALRQPGSAIKPITYAAALSSVPGFTSATPIMDVRTSFPTREGLPYVPENYDRVHHGPISARMALATSNNVAAVNVLQMVGLDKMLSLANQLGIHSFQTVEAYGLALTLGGGEVRLLELTSAYAAFANMGKQVTPFAVTRIVKTTGELLYTHDNQEQLSQVIDPQIAWLITDILSDNAARSEAFGQNSVLRLDRPAAVKTGTTTDWRDNWTVGYTPDLVAGVWTGNADNKPMVRISGVAGAGPIWHDFMLAAMQGQQAREFVRPPSMVQIEVCALSGLLPSADCPYRRLEWFVDGTQPTRVDDWYQRVTIDVATGEPANDSTPTNRIAGRVGVKVPDVASEWAREQGWIVIREQSTSIQAGGNQEVSKCNSFNDVTCKPVIILQPDPGSYYKISKQLPRAVQRVPLQIRIYDKKATRADLVVDGVDLVATFTESIFNGFWSLEPGDHAFTVIVHYADGTAITSAATTIHVTE